MPEATVNTDAPRLVLPKAWEQQLRTCHSYPTQIEFPLADPPLDWLRSQTARTRIVWANRDETNPIVGLGTAACVTGRPNESAESIIDRCRALLVGHPELKFFGGFAFRTREPFDAKEWEALGTARFWLPRLTFDGHRLRLTVLSPSDLDAAHEAVTRLQVIQPTRSEQSPACRMRTDLPNRADWSHKVEQALRLIRDEVLEKIVLARCATFRFEAPLCPLSLMEKLSTGARSCYRFCFQFDRSTAFLGATPERLFRRIDREVESEVIAGTRRRSKNQAEDEKLALELCNSAKEQLEHDIVRKSIRQRLHCCVQQLEVDSQASVLKLPRKQHLYSYVRGILHAGVSDADLLERLHPTPAVGGYPTDIALTEIDRLEPFARGWYAGPIGWIGSDAAEFAVAIRSGLLQGDRLSLYSGAGIVAGSTAEAEWDEIEHKISDFLEIIHSVNGRE